MMFLAVFFYQFTVGKLNKGEREPSDLILFRSFHLSVSYSNKHKIPGDKKKGKVCFGGKYEKE